MRFQFSTLRSALLLPFVGLVVALAATIGGLSYFTGARAVEDYSDQLLGDISNRVIQAARQHLAGSRIALNTVAPDAETFVPGSTASVIAITPQTLAQIEERLWLASGLFPEVSRYVYFGEETGQFVGVNRSERGTELRLKEFSDKPRIVFRSDGPALRGDVLRQDNYDPRTRVWYQSAIAKNGLTWSPIYIDATTKELTFTLAKPLRREDGKARGVVATDIPLKSLHEFFKSLQVSETGIAFAVDANGDLIAASSAEPLVKEIGGNQLRLNAAESGNSLIRAAYGAMRDVTKFNARRNDGTVRTSFDSARGVVDLSASLQSDDAGLNWTMVVAIPRGDHMGNLRRTVLQNLFAGLLAVLVAIALGLWLTHLVTRDVTRLSDATRLLARGEALNAATFDRRDEIGSIAKTMQQLSSGILKDPLTGVFNRATFEKRFEARVSAMRAAAATGKGASTIQFALVFIDLDKFKNVNDQYGHAMGDAVLAVTAQRLASQLRKEDLIARFGGDEFIVLLGHAEEGTPSIEATVARLKKIVSETISVGGRAINIDASFGVAMYPRDGTTLTALTSAADQLMYSDKNTSSDRR